MNVSIANNHEPRVLPRPISSSGRSDRTPAQQTDINSTGVYRVCAVACVATALPGHATGAGNEPIETLARCGGITVRRDRTGRRSGSAATVPCTRDKETKSQDETVVQGRATHPVAVMGWRFRRSDIAKPIDHRCNAR
jgi:hypothetical protein